MFQSDRNKRRYFRLPYPLSDRPRLAHSTGTYEVSEISEKGLRFYMTGHHRFWPGDRFEAEITFHDGEIVAVKGMVGRMTDVEIVLIDLDGITYRRMVQEQRYLIRKYTNFYTQ